MLVKPPDTSPVTGGQLMQLNKWELVQLVMRLGKLMQPEQLREQIAVVRELYRRNGEAARTAERQLGIRRPGARE